MLLVLPVSHVDVVRMAELISWIEELDSKLPQHRFLIVASAKVTLEDCSQISRTAMRIFNGGTVIKQRQDDERGWPYGPNIMFTLAAKWVANNHAGHFLWCESDCIPLVPDWLDTLESEYRRLGKLFMGTVYEHPKRHLNGCMIYPPDVLSRNPYIAGATDVPWDLVRPEINMRHGSTTPLIQRKLQDPQRNLPCTFPDPQSMDQIDQRAVLFHGCKDGTLILRLRERLSNEAPIFRPVVKLAKKTPLTIVLPFCHKDAGIAIKLLEWILEMNDGQQQARQIVLSYDAATDQAMVDQAVILAEVAFHKVFCTKYPSPGKKLCAQTVAFSHAANFMWHKVRQSWLWMEADMIPLRKGWIEAMEQSYHSHTLPFMGVIVPGKGHVNGTAVYPANAPEYIPRALMMTYTAWDTAMRPEMIDRCADCSHLIHHVWGVVNGKFHPFLGESPTFEKGSSLVGQIKSSAVLFHRVKDGSLIDRMREFKPKVVETANRSVEVFIVSFAKDADWLKYCLASITKFATGFSGVTLLVPIQDYAGFARWVTATPGLQLRSYKTPDDPKLWHLAHQVQKCRADEWCPNADFVCHIDSDTIVRRSVRPDDYFKDGKPILWIEEFSRLNGCPWKMAVDLALKIDSKYETMRRHGATHYRGLYASTRKAVEAVHKMPFDAYALSCKPTFPWEFSEFNVLGNVALSPEWKDRYSFVDVGRTGRPPDPFMLQFWSNSPPDKMQDLPSGGRAVPVVEINKILA